VFDDNGASEQHCRRYDEHQLAAQRMFVVVMLMMVFVAVLMMVFVRAALVFVVVLVMMLMRAALMFVVMMMFVCHILLLF
jgi:hypothetical protein